MFEDLKKRIEDDIARELEDRGLQIIDLTVQHRNKTVAVELLLDHEEGGINLEECSHFNKRITRLIEGEHLLTGDYTVEVSSPGLDRPLRTERDFRRVIGKEVRFYLKERVAERLEHDGIVRDVSDERVVVETPLKAVTIPLGSIQKALQII